MLKTFTFEFSEENSWRLSFPIHGLSISLEKEMDGCDILAVFKYISPFYAVVKDLLVSFKTGQ